MKLLEEEKNSIIKIIIILVANASLTIETSSPSFSKSTFFIYKYKSKVNPINNVTSIVTKTFKFPMNGTPILKLNILLITTKAVSTSDDLKKTHENNTIEKV
jgi:hypothetical protein